jgi:DNA-binding transcriptional MerR regulator
MKDLEERTQVSRESIHFYLREGLLPEPERPKRNVAHYSEEHVVRIRLIKRLQEERFLPLGVIKQMLEQAEGALAGDSGNIAAFELALQSLLGGDVPHPDEPVGAVAERAGLDREDIEALHRAGAVTITEDGSGPALDFRDAAIVAQWGRLLDLGYRGRQGYDAGYLARYAQLMEQLAEIEVDLFLNAFGATLNDQTAAMATRGIDVSNEILSRMRTRALLKTLAQRVDSEPS